MISLPQGLSAQDIQDRRNFIGGSDAKIIMRGTPQDIADLISVKRGEKKPKNLDRVLAVQMGIWTEEANRQWYTLMTGRSVTDVGERRHHFLDDFMACTLDGMTVTSHDQAAILQAKHSFDYNMAERRQNTIRDLVETYFDQITHEMYVCNVSWAVLIAFFGNNRWDYAEVEFDQAYCDNILIPRLKMFWDCRVNGTRWPELPAAQRPDISRVLRVSKPVDMSANNRWCDLAAQWRNLKPAVKELDQVTEELCTMVDKEKKRTFGAGVVAYVAKNGSVTIKADPTWSVANDDDISY